MIPIPAAALAAIRAALDDYRLTTPPDQATPAGQAQQIGMYLASMGYAITPDTSVRAPGPRERAA